MGDRADALAKNTPLFYYILRESEVVEQCRRFGPTGSAILMEVFGGMLKLCKTSFLTAYHEQGWRPDPAISREKQYWMSGKYGNGFDIHRVIDDDDYYPLELADIVRFVKT